MQSDDPAYLEPGSEVSAKFKGAYCEATIKKVQRNVKVKVSYKDPPFGNSILNSEMIIGPLLLNAVVKVPSKSDTKIYVPAQIVSFKDSSLYSVVFDDEDERTLRRTQLCLKGAKHFDENLDSMPLTNPETFSAPVSQSTNKSSKVGNKRKSDETQEISLQITKRISRCKPTISKQPTNAQTQSSHDEDELSKAIKNGYESDSQTATERDMFVARWYKFQEDKGDPMNSTPKLGGIDVDLYKMYRCVRILGGYNKVERENLWFDVLNMMKVDTIGPKVAHIKKFYRKYMLEFDNFVRQFGWSYSGGERRITKNKEATPAIPSTSSDKTRGEHRKPIMQKVARKRLSSTLTPTDESKDFTRQRSSSTTPSNEAVHSKSPTRDKEDKFGARPGTRRDSDGVLHDKYIVSVGDKLEAFNRNEWYPARVLLIDVDDTNARVSQVVRVYVHYHGWKARFDEWVLPINLRIPVEQLDTIEVITDKDRFREKSCSAQPNEKVKLLKDDRKTKIETFNVSDSEISMTSSPQIGAQKKECKRKIVSNSKDVMASCIMPSKMMKVGSSDDDTLLDEVKDDANDEDCEEDDDVKIEKRITRSRAANDPNVQVIRKWSKSNILQLEEEERPTSSTAKVEDQQEPSSGENLMKQPRAVARRAFVPRHNEDIEPLSIDKIDSDCVVECGHECDQVDGEIKMPVVEHVEDKLMQLIQFNRINNTENEKDDARKSSDDRDDVSTPNTAGRSQRNKPRRPATRAIKCQRSPTPPTIRPRKKNCEALASPLTNASHNNLSTSPHKDSIAALKAKIYARMQAHNAEELQQCAKIAVLENGGDLSDEQCIDLIRKRMEQVQKLYSQQRSRLLKIDKICKARAQAQSSSGEQSTSSSTPPQASSATIGSASPTLLVAPS